MIEIRAMSVQSTKQNKCGSRSAVPLAIAQPGMKAKLLSFRHQLARRVFMSAIYMLFFCSVMKAQAPVRFIENKNQWPGHFDFVSPIPGGEMAVSAGSFRYFFIDREKLNALHHNTHKPDALSSMDNDVRGHAVFVEFDGANSDSEPRSFGRSSEYYNYYLGNDPGHWASHVYAYEGVLYENIYEGIDLKVYAAGENVKYDFAVAPGSDPDVIRMVYQGADQIALDKSDLHVTTSLAEVVEKKPVAWQWIAGEKVYVTSSFRLEGNVVSFEFPNGFDTCHELIIDPLLIFSTFSGSTADNWGSTATPGEHGNLYSAGVTEQFSGGTFPATPGAFQTTTGGLYDIGILKYDSLGTNLLYATYLGGSNSESPHSLVMNDDEELLLLGTTSSSDFPTSESAYDRVFNGGLGVGHVIAYNAGSDIVISRFNRDGTALLASTFFGGSANDGLNPSGGSLARNYGDQLRGDIITDAAGNVYVSSVTESADLFTTPRGFQPIYQGGETDALLLKLDAALSNVIIGTYVGGNAADASHSIKLDRAGHIFLAGGTASNDFPVTPDSYQPGFGGEVDGWIAKVSSDGSGILQATYTGTNQYNQVYFLDLNADEEVYVYGQTVGDFPITPGVYSNPGSGQFVQKFSNDLDTVIFSTVFGAGRGVPDISPTAFLVNDCNNLYMSGWGGLINTATGHWPNTNSSTFGLPTTPDAFQSNTSGSDFYFIVLTDDATERLYATFLGGSQSRTHVDGGTSRFDKGGIVYHSVCSGCQSVNAAEQPTSDFPTTPGAWSRQNRSWNCNNAAFKFDLSSLKARLRTNSAERDMPGVKVVCLPDPIAFENLSTGGEYF
ncbi:MAG TPA: PKD domain-containing protein, partial [Chryseosolibacter sp.]|nr:PKD domain-containing protein [Chryseosolibacter sp.]